MATELNEERDKALEELAILHARRIVEHDRRQAELEAIWDKFWAHLEAKGLA